MRTVSSLIAAGKHLHRKADALIENVWVRRGEIIIRLRQGVVLDEAPILIAMLAAMAERLGHPLPTYWVVPFDGFQGDQTACITSRSALHISPHGELKIAPTTVPASRLTGLVDAMKLVTPTYA